MSTKQHIEQTVLRLYVCLCAHKCLRHNKFSWDCVCVHTHACLRHNKFAWDYVCVCVHTHVYDTTNCLETMCVCVCAHTCLRHHKFSWDYVCVCVHTHVYDTTTCLETCVCVCAHTCLRHNNMSWDMCVCVCLCAYACGLQSFRVQSDFCGLQIPDSVSSVCWRCHLGVINGITSWAPHPWSVDCSRVSFACATGYPELIPGSYKSKDIPALPMYDL